jgi:hypothetical protein
MENLRIRKSIAYIVSLIVFGAQTPALFAGQTLVAQKVNKAPVIDGMGNDAAWSKAQAIITHDKVADVDITLKAIYTDKEIFFLVSFPDPNESRTHKSWVWDNAREIYKMGKDREDTFVFKWNMKRQPIDLSIYADNPYKADIWFWKACRTDPAGFADDKIHILSSEKMEEDATNLTSKGGKTMYLVRREDKGKAAYKTELRVEYKGNVLPRFSLERPTGSRADVKAKGIWENGRWTIEFRRLLNTGNADDIQFDLTKSYQFGVSRYEIAARAANPKLTQPLYGSGDVGEELILIFASAD